MLNLAIRSAALLTLGLATLVPAQYVTVKRAWDRSSRIRYNDIWGIDHTDAKGLPTGRSFVFVGETAGIWLLDTTDPSNIKQVRWWSAPSSTWRDFTNVGNYIYVSTENRSQRGFRVIDMTNPNAPFDVGYVQTSRITSAHNVSADPKNGFIYFSGSNQGVAIFDVKTNPRNPTLIANWRTTYVHDICIRRDRAYFSLGRSYQVRILNAKDPRNLITIGNCNTPGGYAHNAWVSEDDKILCCTDELRRGSSSPHMTVWDISNPAVPVKRGDYDLGTTVHNVYVLGRTAYMSHYGAGVHVADLADPTNPTKLASYDTTSCWGCYPFEDSGIIYASDTSDGFYALQLDRGHMNRYGTGTPGSNGRVPRARFDGASPRVGATKLRLECENLEPNRLVWIVVANAPGTGAVLGAQLHVNLSGSVVAGPLRADANGRLSVATPVPNDAGQAGKRIYLQLFADRGNGTLTSSKGMWAGIAAR